MQELSMEFMAGSWMKWCRMIEMDDDEIEESTAKWTRF
jgi:hypothetical protein